MPRSAHTNVSDNWLKISGIWTKVDTDWNPVVAAWTKIDANWVQWWPDSGGPEPTCPDPGDYEPALVSGGGSSGGTFNLGPYAGCGINAAAAKVGFSDILTGTNVSVTVAGSPSGTFFRTITVTPEWSNRVIYFDLGATAASQFESGAAIGYTLSGDPAFTRIVSSRLRVTL